MRSSTSKKYNWHCDFYFLNTCIWGADDSEWPQQQQKKKRYKTMTKDTIVIMSVSEIREVCEESHLHHGLWRLLLPGDQGGRSCWAGKCQTVQKQKKEKEKNTGIRQKDQFDLNEWWGLGCVYVCSYADSVLDLAGCWCWCRFSFPVQQVNFFPWVNSAGSPQCSYSSWMQLDAFTSVQHWYVRHDLGVQK